MVSRLIAESYAEDTIEEQEEQQDDGLLDHEESPRHVAARAEGSRLAISKFFAQKRYWCGGTIPQSKLFSVKNINLVMQASIIDAIDTFHALLASGETPENVDRTDIEWESRMILAVFTEAARLRISKDCYGGLLLLFLEFCEGFICLDSVEVDHQYCPDEVRPAWEYRSAI